MFEASSLNEPDNARPPFSMRQILAYDERTDFTSRAHEAVNNFVAPTLKAEPHVRIRRPAA